MSELYLVHHGIKGQKWGIRRYQNEDGSLTKAGLSRYGDTNNRGVLGEYSKHVKITNDMRSHMSEVNKAYRANKKQNRKDLKSARADIKNNTEIDSTERKMQLKQLKSDYRAEKKQNRKDLKEENKRTQENALKAVAKSSHTGKALASGALMTLGGVYIANVGSTLSANGHEAAGNAIAAIGMFSLGGGAAVVANTISSQKYK